MVVPLKIKGHFSGNDYFGDSSGKCSGHLLILLTGSINCKLAELSLKSPDITLFCYKSDVIKSGLWNPVGAALKKLDAFSLH